MVGLVSVSVKANGLATVKVPLPDRWHASHVAAIAYFLVFIGVERAACRPRRACLAEHCGRREYLKDDIHVVTLSNELLAAPPVDLWPKVVPKVVRRVMVPPEVEAILPTELKPVG
jgi:hypothetical protein